MDFEFPMSESTLRTINCTYTQVREEDKGGFFAKCGVQAGQLSGEYSWVSCARELASLSGAALYEAVSTW